MKLRPEFEATHSNLMNCNPMPSLDVCFGELLREEQRLTTQATYPHDKMISNAMAYAAQGKGKGRDMRKVQCFNCKEYRHIATNCTRKSYNYCKKLGHIIKECPTRPQNRQANAYQSTVDYASSATTSDSSALSTEKLQQVIIFAFSTLGLQGNGSLSPSWIIDSGASNQMTSSSDTLSNVQTYIRSTHIHIVNGCQLPIHAIGDVDSTIRDVFVSPQLSTRLISIGQLVDNNCDVVFLVMVSCAGSGVGQDTCKGA
ncbi:hypothetical protein Pint_29733 [Pistacia integerrima]|uniref:Uncharacterized protein n=1 Tax=Pistacia integerrima TaxID=434235 RepID=A0ACC0X024_9ROSI|nr:hypothetical protein Pint_29733 [Pistacia integerrima]